MAMKTSLRPLAAVVILAASLLVASCSATGTTSPTPSTATGQAATGWVQLAQAGGEKQMQWKQPPKMMLDKSKDYRAVMETEHGEMVLDLFARDVPNTVNNFVFLATQGYFDNTTFHRVLANFVVQGGDPTGTGMGGPGYTFANEITSHKHDAGAISMANAGPNTNGSQFFICLTAQHGLDGQYNVFGQLVDGWDVLKAIRLRDPDAVPPPTYPGDKLISVRIEVKDAS
jgi:peptidyl-prolyl cis-trans isomerase B (cyclophilin B)